MRAKRREASIRLPVAGRPWDVLWLLAGAVRRAPSGTDTIAIDVHVRDANRPGVPPPVTLKAMCGPGDPGEPVVTILRPDED
jgi:hypothetical protein